MLSELDRGIRCDKHTGDAMPPRCYDCDDLVKTWGELDFRLCPTHPAHFRPCEKCEASDDNS